MLLSLFALPRLVQVLKAYPSRSPPRRRRRLPHLAALVRGLAFHHNKLAGGLFVLGLVVNLVFGL